MLLVLCFKKNPCKFIPDDHSRVIIYGENGCPEYINASFIEVNFYDVSSNLFFSLERIKIRINAKLPISFHINIEGHV